MIPFVVFLAVLLLAVCVVVWSGRGTRMGSRSTLWRHKLSRRRAVWAGRNEYPELWAQLNGDDE